MIKQITTLFILYVFCVEAMARQEGMVMQNSPISIREDVAITKIEVICLSLDVMTFISETPDL
jgi:hypothetical protein